MVLHIMVFGDIAIVRFYRALNRTQQRLLWSVAQTALLTLVLLWVAPFLSVAAPGVVSSRDSVAAVLACVTRIPEALSLVREERTRTATEKAAFEEFADRVRRLETGTPPEPTPTVGGPQHDDTGTRAEGADLAAVRSTYRETVMETDHFAEEYDESLGENLAAEFGPDYATALAGEGTLTPALQQSLLAASQRAARERASFLHTLDRELDALVDARRRLRSVSEATEELRETPFERRSFGEVVQAEDRLECLKSDCEAVVEDRQAELREQPDGDGTSFREYLYGSQAWSHPVISDALSCLEQVRAVEHQVVQAVLGRP